MIRVRFSSAVPATQRRQSCGSERATTVGSLRCSSRFSISGRMSPLRHHSTMASGGFSCGSRYFADVEYHDGYARFEKLTAAKPFSLKSSE